MNADDIKLSIRFDRVERMPILCVDGRDAACIDEMELGMPSTGGRDFVITKIRVYRATGMGAPTAELPKHPSIEEIK